LTGKGEMLRNDAKNASKNEIETVKITSEISIPCELCREKEKLINILQAKNAEITEAKNETIKALQDKIELMDIRIEEYEGFMRKNGLKLPAMNTAHFAQSKQ
jgi:phage host-nuclease inhibitor protein Gam